LQTKTLETYDLFGNRSKLSNYGKILRDDGLSYGDYPSAWLRTGSERLTFLLFLKMADGPANRLGNSLEGAKYA
jgi:hypothetical protein